MPVKKQRDSGSLATKFQLFDPKAAELRGRTRGRHFELVAEIFGDGEDYVINPQPCSSGRLYRLPKDAVEIVSDAFPYYCDSGPTRTAHRIRIASEAACVGFEHGTAVSLLMPDATIEALERTTATLRADVDLKADGFGTLKFGSSSVQCRGRKDYDYVKDVTNNGVEDVDKFVKRYSTEFGVWMPWAVLIDGARGVFIHEFPLASESAGCIHLTPDDAKAFYNWITGKVRITISYPW